MAYGNNFYNLITESFEVNETTEVRLKLDENTRSGNLFLQIREFKTAGEYVGPTKNGFTYHAESVEDVDLLQEKLLVFFNKVREELMK